MKTSNRILIVTLTVAVMIAMTSIADFLEPSHVVSLLRPISVKAAQPKSAKAVFSLRYTTVYCEEPNGNEIYETAGNSGVAIFVVPGGCK